MKTKVYSMPVVETVKLEIVGHALCGSPDGMSIGGPIDYDEGD